MKNSVYVLEAFESLETIVVDLARPYWMLADSVPTAAAAEMVQALAHALPAAEVPCLHQAGRLCMSQEESLNSTLGRTITMGC